MGASEQSVRIRVAIPADSEFALQVKEAALRHYAEPVEAWEEQDQRCRHIQRFAEQDFYVIEGGPVRVGVTLCPPGSQRSKAGRD